MPSLPWISNNCPSLSPVRYASAKAAPILGEGGALSEVMAIAESAGNMDADGDGHVSAAEAMAFAKKLHNEASPMIAR
jgi:hypothetical protein